MKKDATPRKSVVPGDLDLAIFKLLYDYRLLRREHLSALTGRHPTRLHRRLLLLVQSHYLTRLPPLAQQKHIYALGKRAGSILVEQGNADVELLEKRSRVHELKPSQLPHEMMIVDLHVILELAARQSPVRLVSWKEGAALFDDVMVADHDGAKKIPIRPDAFFTLEDSDQPAGANRAHFFLEADRSSASHPRLRDKFRGYWHYLQQGRHQNKFHIKNFTAVTVTITDDRARFLCAFVQSLVPERARKYFVFTSLERFGLENPSPILEAAHFSPRNTELRYPLIRSRPRPEAL